MKKTAFYIIVDRGYNRKNIRYKCFNEEKINTIATNLSIRNPHHKYMITKHPEIFGLSVSEWYKKKRRKKKNRLKNKKKDRNQKS